MRIIRISLIYLSLFSCFLSPSLYTVCGLSSDGTTLLSLMRHWNSIPLSISSSWNASDYTPCSSWVGVHCDHDKLVVGLNLSSYQISGQIRPEIAYLKHLQLIDFSSNNLSGSIPQQLGNCSLLDHLDLSLNFLTEKIPETLGNLQNLRYINISNNQLIGTLPDTLNNLVNLVSLDVNSNSLEGTIPLGSSGSCKELVYLDLSFNVFNTLLPPGLGNCSRLQQFAAVECGLTGSIPSSFGQLTRITILHLPENSLSGKIPPELGNCKSLTHLQLQGNQLEGDIPSELGMLSELQTLRLFNNLLTGEVPMSIWKIQSLEILLIYNNNLFGELPAEITEMKGLKEITLYNNRFSGVIPQGLGINTSVTIIDFTNNSFTGKIPPNLCFGKQLQRLILGFNHLEGSVPSDVGTCSSLTRLILQHNNLSGALPEFTENPNLLYMNLRNNNFSGEIPASFGNLANITSIDLSMNKLSGLVPPKLGNLVDLQALNLSHNSLEGPLPTQLSNCNGLFQFDASHNMLNGSIPASLGRLTRLSILGLSDNRFSGGIPSFLSELQALTNLQLGGNILGGNIPSSIAALLRLHTLNLSSNELTGEIPADFDKLALLEQLDFSRNNLTGTLTSLGDISSLTDLDVSYNFFTGSIPAALLMFLNSSSFLGNSGLCVNCGLSCGQGSSFRLCVDLQSSNQKGSLSKFQRAMIAVGSSVFVVGVLFGLILLILRLRRQKWEIEGSPFLLSKVMEATENLNEKYIIGRGGHGTVYKASLGPEEVYAVKKLVFGESKEGSTSMAREVQTVRKVRHRNLVRLEEFRLEKEYGLILYRHMENGSLHDVLHEIYPPPSLEWNIRYKIALGTAQGLSYLHFDCDPAIIHLDIKPMNILLDNEMEPHISDFGIAKLLDQSSASLLITNTLRGTIGYIAPENAYTTMKSKESDVYSYGVVLLELITRKMALDPSFMEGVDIVGWVRSLWSHTEDVNMIVDQGLLDELFEAGVREKITEVLLLALRCTEKEASRRPSMREVVKKLENANEIFRNKQK